MLPQIETLLVLQDRDKALRELRHDICFIIVTHDLPFASQVATQGIFLAEGRVRAAGPVAEIIKQATAPSPVGA